MDPLSQAVLGASLSQCFAKKENFKIAIVSGALGGLLPDIDVLIHSSSDPLLALQFHRHFTHSLIMVPFLALPVALAVWYFSKKKISLKEIYLYAFLGVLTHGLLDACTSYGTQLLWPFSNLRVAWNNVAIIDPLFTIPGLIGVLWADKIKSLKVAHVTFLMMIVYLFLGVYQRDIATQAARDLAKSRNHHYVRIEAKPSIGSLLLWRSLYETPEGVFYVDAINTTPGRKPKVYEGSSVEKWTLKKLNKDLSPESVLKKDIERFNWFSDDYLFQSSSAPFVLGDLRYATIPNSLEPLWGISFHPDEESKHVSLEYFRVVNDKIKSTFKKMFLGQDL